MPSIPTYGFDELEPSILNSVKRRVIGLMDMSQEALTQKPETDPTNGKQNTLVEELTEEVYTTIKDIEVLDNYISQSSGVDLKDLRVEIKKGASQFALVNNALRKINTTYDKLRPNMIYTDLKIFIGFVNSVKILKKTALRFFEISDELIESYYTTIGTPYVKPTIDFTIVDEPTEELPTEAPPTFSGVELGSVGIEPPQPPAPPPPLPGPVPPVPAPKPPPKKAQNLHFAMIKQKAQDAGLDATETQDVETRARDYLTANNSLAPESEIDEMIAMIVMIKTALKGLTDEQKGRVGDKIDDYVAANNGQMPSEIELANMVSEVENETAPITTKPTFTPVFDVLDTTERGIVNRAESVENNPIYKDGRNVLKSAKIDYVTKLGEKRPRRIIDKAEEKLLKLIEIGEKPFIKYSSSDVKNLSPDDRTDFNKLYKDYDTGKRKLNGKTTLKEQAVLDFMTKQGIQETTT
jgi:hypothetical protein